MKLKTVCFTVCALLVADLANSSVAHASLLGSASVRLDSWGAHGGSNVGVTLYTGINGSGTGGTVVKAGESPYYGGILNWTVNSSSFTGAATGSTWQDIGAAAGTQIRSFCIEILENVGFGSTYNTSLVSLDSAPLTNGGLGTMGAAAAADIARIWKNYGGGTTNDNNTAAALQLAIWKLDYEKGNAFSYDLTKGNLRLTSGASDVVATTAQNMLSWVQSHQTAAQANLIAIQGVNGSFQDQVVELNSPIPDSGPTVPEPASAAMWLVLAVAGISSRRRRRIS